MTFEETAPDRLSAGVVVMIPRSVDVAHAAGAEHALDLEVAEARAGIESHGGCEAGILPQQIRRPGHSSEFMRFLSPLRSPLCHSLDPSPHRMAPPDRADVRPAAKLL